MCLNSCDHSNALLNYPTALTLQFALISRLDKLHQVNQTQTAKILPNNCNLIPTNELRQSHDHMICTTAITYDKVHTNINTSGIC